MVTLFSSGYIEKLISKIEIPDWEKKKEVVKDWRESVIEDCKQKETSIKSAFNTVVFEKLLGYKQYGSKGQDYNFKEEYNVKNVGRADFVLGELHNDIVEIVGELKSLNDDLDKPQKSRKDLKTPVEQGLDYLENMLDFSKFLLVSNQNEIRIYKRGIRNRFDVFYFVVPGTEKEKGKTDLSDDNELKKFIYLLSKENLLRNNKEESETEKILRTQTEEEKHLEKKFYGEYKELREKIFFDLLEGNPEYKNDKHTLLSLTQKFLDRIIFCWFCEDSREQLLPPDVLGKLISKELKDEFYDKNGLSIYAKVKGLFNAINEGNPVFKIEEGYNGGLFQQDKALDNLKIHNEIFEIIGNLSKYDFGNDEILNVNVLGHIFEQSISDLEELRSEFEGQEYDKKKSKRKKEGVYYTPEYITRYIVENTVGKWLEERMEEAREKNKRLRKNKEFKVIQDYQLYLQKIKILDPACGSGAFLVQAFDYILAENKRVIDLLNELDETAQHRLFDTYTYVKSILQNNLYGVDLNPESVEITKLSLWLKTAERNKKLTELDNNIKCGNSLIDDPEIAGNKAFKWEEEFDDLFKKCLSKFHHITFETKYSRKKSKDETNEAVLLSDEDRKLVAQAISEKSKELGFKVLACSILPDHCHIIIADMGNEISKIVNKVKGYSSYIVNRTLKGAVQGEGRQMALWSKRYDNTFLDTEEHIKNAIEYVLNNYEKHKDRWEKIEHTEIDKILKPIISKYTEEKDFEYIDGGFDCVIGNPPYVRQEKILNKDWLVMNYDVGNGVADLYVYFYEKGYKLLYKNGFLGFITSNTFMRTSYGKDLRLYLSQNPYLINVFNFGEKQFFEGVTTYPTIIILRNYTFKNLYEINFFELEGKDVITDFNKILKEKPRMIKSNLLSESEWVIGNNRINIVKKKILERGIKFGEYTEKKVYFGIKTGLDKAFVIDKNTKDKLIKENTKSAEIIKPLLRGRNISKWYYNFEDNYLIFTRRGTNIELYKAIKNYLLQYKDDLSPKKNKEDQRGRKPGTYKWYEIQDTIKYYQEYEKPKIIYANMAQTNRFVMDSNNYYTNPKTFIIAKEDYYLLSILNSKLVFFLVKLQFPKLKGDTYEFRYKDCMENIPIASPTEKQRKILEKKAKTIHRKSRNNAFP